MPRRTYAQLLGRLLHDATADKARAISRISGPTAIIVPYDIASRIAQAIRDRFEQPIAQEVIAL